MTQNTEQKAKAISERFTDLSNHAEKLAFPDYRKGILSSKDTTNWNIVLRYIYTLSHPFTAISISSSLFFFLWIGLYFASFLAFTIGLTFLYPLLFNQPLFLPPPDIETQVFLVFGVAVGVFVGLISYPWWIDTLIEKKNPWWIKLALVIAVYWIINIILKSLIAQSPSTSLQITPNTIPTILYSFLLLLIPAVTYAVAILFDLSLAVLLLIRTVFGGIRSIHNPRPVETVLQLATKKISVTNPEESSWTLLDLPQSEIIVLRTWAEANRDGSEKRTAPAFFVAALVGVLLTSDLVRSNVDRFITWLMENVSAMFSSGTSKLFPPQIPAFFLLVFLLMFASFVIKNMTTLFRNIVAQNLIVEACIVAEHAKQHEINKSKEEKPIILEWLRKLSKLF